MNFAFFWKFHIGVVLCTLIKISLCNDYYHNSDSYEDFYQEEIADFSQWLQMKIRHHEIEVPHHIPRTTPSLASKEILSSSSPSIVRDTLSDRENNMKNSRSEKDFSVKHSKKKLSDELLEDLSESNKRKMNLGLADNQMVSTLIPLLATSKGEPSEGMDSISKGFSVEGNSNSSLRDYGYSKAVLDETLDEYHRIHKDDDSAGDVLYERRSNSESSDSLSNMLSSLISHSEFKGDLVIKAIEISSSRHEGNELHFDTCSTKNNVLSQTKVCPSSLQYNVERHLSSKYFEATRMKMVEKTHIPMQHSEDGLCNYNKHLGPERGVNERALCPFRWTVSPRNQARIPEYLLMAECACPESRSGKHHKARCAEVWSKIRVLWQMSCNGSKHTYREGWEEIPVACAPIGRHITRSKPGINVKLEPPK